MFPRKILTFKASEIAGNAFIFTNPHAKILSNVNHHSVSFLHKNAVDLTKKIVCAFNAKIISTFVNAKRYYDVRPSWPGRLEVWNSSHCLDTD